MHPCPVRLLARFRRDERAATSLLFAIALLPMLIAVGVAVDYGRIIRFKTVFNRAADAAALSAVAMTPSGQYSAPQQSSVAAYFAGELGDLATMVPYTVSAAATMTSTSMTVKVNYTAALPMTLTQIIGVDAVNFSGSATAAVDFPKYYDFYLLLDNSPSMGLAATTNDISKLQTLTGGCAFACHQHSFDAAGSITGDDFSDFYHVAKANNVVTRIDVLRTSTQELTTTATQAQAVPNQFRMAVYTFSDILTPIAGLSSNLAGVQAAASAIDLAYAYRDQRDTQTDYLSALNYVTAIIPPGGDGSSQANAQKFLFIVTDGVEDKPAGSASGSGNQPDLWTSGVSGWPAGSSPNTANTQIGNVNPTRQIGTLNPAMCSYLKNNGIKVAVLYTTYLPVPTNGFYTQWVAPLASSIPSNLSSCASPGLYFEVTPSQGISAAMQAMFAAALASARLTN